MYDPSIEATVKVPEPPFELIWRELFPKETPPAGVITENAPFPLALPASPDPLAGLV